MLEARWDDCVEMARDQIREGAHMSSLCVTTTSAGRRRGHAGVGELLRHRHAAAIVLDSTEVDVLRAGLEKLGGRAVINSIVNWGGDASRFAKVTGLAQEHGAALIALTIDDEEGQARTVGAKVAIAERLIEDLTTNWGIHESDILIDTLTFTICTGQEESRKDGIATIEAIRELKRRRRRADHAGPVEHLLRTQPSHAHPVNSVFLDESSRRAWTRRSCTRRRSSPSRASTRRGQALDLISAGASPSRATNRPTTPSRS